MSIFKKSLLVVPVLSLSLLVTQPSFSYDTCPQSDVVDGDKIKVSKPNVITEGDQALMWWNKPKSPEKEPIEAPIVDPDKPGKNNDQ